MSRRPLTRYVNRIILSKLKSFFSQWRFHGVVAIVRSFSQIRHLTSNWDIFCPFKESWILCHLNEKLLLPYQSSNVIVRFWLENPRLMIDWQKKKTKTRPRTVTFSSTLAWEKCIEKVIKKIVPSISKLKDIQIVHKITIFILAFYISQKDVNGLKIQLRYIFQRKYFI